MSNRPEEARRIFLDVVRSNPKDGRAYHGLAFEAWLRGNEQQTWEYRKQALALETNPHSFVYATISGSTFSAALRNPSSGAREQLLMLIDKPDSMGILRAAALERLGNQATRQENITEAQQWFDKMGALTLWRIVGPFDNVSASGHDKLFGPEVEDDTSAVYRTAEGGQIRWQSPLVQRRDSWIDMTYFAPSHEGVFYSVCYVKLAKTQRVHLRIGTSGSFKAFVNGSLIRETSEELNNDLDTYITECTLGEGWNKILIKLGASDLDRCNFMARITDERGIPIRIDEMSTRPQSTSTVPPNPTIVSNPFLDDLERRIEQNPLHIENYLYMADALLRNDEANKAIAILRRARTLAPEFVLIDIYLLDAYQRSDRRDEYLSLIEHCASKMPNIPMSLLYRFNRAFTQDKLEEADSLLETVRLKDSTSTTYFDWALVLANRRSEYRTFSTLLDKAFELHPYSYRYASIAASTAAQGGRGTKEAIAIIKRQLATGISTGSLELLAQYELESGDIRSALATYDRLLALVPVGCGYYSSIASIYIDRKEYTDALASINRALAIAPNSSRYHYKKAVILKSMGHVIEASAAMQRALDIDPSNFEARTFIRELQGKPHPLQFMPTVNVDSVMKAAPDASSYPNDGALLLYSGDFRVVYDGSRCDVQREYIIKVFTTDGIDAFKEMSIPQNGSLSIEKAVVKKARGREIQADRGVGQLVFKSLEQGDIIHLKYRMSEATAGRLGIFFEDEFSFNSGWPTLQSVYGLLTPKAYPFTWRVYGKENSPEITTNDYGDLWLWRGGKEPAIEYEEDMPNYSDMDDRVVVSNVPGWGEIVSWYHDISHTKTRSSAEVRELVDSLFPPGTNPTKEEIINEVYRYITREIRYSYVPFRQSGFVPQKAEKVLNTRIGDCKDVATLCIAMLAERNIVAYPVLVQTRTSPFFRAPNPGIVFDHAIVMVPGDSLPLFIDLTADNVPIGSVPYADRDAFILTIRPGNREPNRLGKMYYQPNTLTVESVVTISEDYSAEIVQKHVVTGAATQPLRSAWRESSEKDRIKSITELLSEDYPDVEVSSFETSDLERLDPSVEFTVVFTVPNYLMEAGPFLIARLPWQTPVTTLTALSYPTRVHPFAYESYYDSTRETVHISVPRGYVFSEEKSKVDVSLPLVSYNKTSTIKDGVLTIDRRSTASTGIVEVRDYPDFKMAYNRMVKEDRKNILFMPKGTVVKVPKKGAK